MTSHKLKLQQNFAYHIKSLDQVMQPYRLWCFFSLLLQRFPPEAGSDHGNFQGGNFSNFTNKHQSFQSFSQYSLHYLQQYMLESTAKDTNLINLVSIRVAQYFTHL